MPSVRFRAVLCLLPALIVLFSVLPCASAEGPAYSALTDGAAAESLSDPAGSTADPDGQISSDASSDPVSTENSAYAPRWSSAEAAIRDLLDEFEMDDSGVGVAYYNTVTGEEYYLNPDEYMVAASMYKVPLNMVYAERVANGELDPDSEIGGYPYRTLLEETIIHSDNDLAAVLRYHLGDYWTYRRTIAPYMGEDPDTVGARFYENNLFTPRQMLYCLKLLYNEPDRFPSVLECMQQAEPDDYFCRDEHRYTIAHKYGCYEENGVLHLNDCAIIPTEDPIIIVLFTSGIDRAEDFLTAFCTRCIDYTESVTAARKAEEEAIRQAEQEAAEEAARKEAAAQAQAEAAREEAEAQLAAEQQQALMASHARAGAVLVIIVCLIGLGFVFIVSLVLFIRRLHAGEYGPMFIYLLLSLVAVCLLGLACWKLFL